jgi:hypothetical protein
MIPLYINPDVTLDLKPGSGVKVNAPNPQATTISITSTDSRFKGSSTTVDADPRPPLAPTVKPRPAIKRKVSYQGIIVRKDGVQQGFGFHLRHALPKSDGTTTPTTSPQDSGTVHLHPAPSISSQHRETSPQRNTSPLLQPHLCKNHLWGSPLPVLHS